MGSWSFFEQKEDLVENFVVDPWRACPAVEFSSRSSVFASLHETRALQRCENGPSTPLAPSLAGRVSTIPRGTQVKRQGGRPPEPSPRIPPIPNQLDAYAYHPLALGCHHPAKKR